MLPEKKCSFIKYDELNSAIQAHSTFSFQGAVIRGAQIKVGWGKARFLLF